MSNFSYDDDYDGYYDCDDDENLACDECGNVIPSGRLVDPAHDESCSLYPYPRTLSKPQPVTPEPSTPKPSEPEPSTSEPSKPKYWRGVVTLKTDDEYFVIHFADDSRYVTVWGNGKIEVNSKDYPQ